MKHVLFALFFFFYVSLLITERAYALPAHIDGFGIFTFKSSVPAAASKDAARAYARDIKAKGFSFAMVKSHDGSSWGTKVNGKWVPCFSKDLAEAFHAENMRVYSYFTARLQNDNSIVESVRLAALTLDMGADGVIIDDLGLFGLEASKWEKVFSLLRKETDARKDKILMSSTFPHLSNVKKRLWGITFKYSDYFLPQNYWMQFEAFDGHGKKKTMDPAHVLAYGQNQFDNMRARYPDSPCKLIPIGRTYGTNTNAASINRFINSAARFYHGAGLFVIEKEPAGGGWPALKTAMTAFKPGRKLSESLSCFDQVNGPCRDTPDKPAVSTPMPTEKKKGDKVLIANKKNPPQKQDPPTPLKKKIRFSPENEQSFKF